MLADVTSMTAAESASTDQGVHRSLVDGYIPHLRDLAVAEVEHEHLIELLCLAVAYGLSPLKDDAVLVVGEIGVVLEGVSPIASMKRPNPSWSWSSPL